MAFAQVGIELEFKGEGVDEKGYIKSINHEVCMAAANIDHQKSNIDLAIGKEVLSVDLLISVQQK